MTTTTSFDCKCAREHVETCAACGRSHSQEHWLGLLLRSSLPRTAAPPALRERVGVLLRAAQPDEPAGHVRHWLLGGAACVGLLALASVLAWSRPRPQPAAAQPLVREMLNDHLRVIYAANPLEIANGSVQQVKPWFTGRLDFAPDLGFGGDEEFVLAGGAVGYVLDRKAATLVFKRRRHTISCFVFRAHGLPWPEGDERALEGGSLRAHTRTLDGFHLVMWRDTGLAYALVSDAGEVDLLRLGSRLAR